MAEKTRTGLFYEDGTPIYYKNGIPKHAGVIQINGEIYYAGKGGRLAVGQKVVHRSMAHGLLEHGTYRFDQDGKLDKDYYVAPRVRKKSHRKKQTGKKKNNVWKILIPVLIVTLTVVVLGVVLSRNTVSDTNRVQQSVGESPWIDLPPSDEEVYLCSKAMQSYYQGELSLDKAISVTSEGAYTPYVFRYRLDPGDKAELSFDGKTYELSSDNSVISIDNLLVGTKYPYTVSVTRGSETRIYESSITTAATNRFVYLPGVYNTRDIGGYKTISGKKVRQGVLIRGTEIDGMVEGKYFLTDKEAATPFHFAYDFDLREEDLSTDNYQSRLGENVRHKFYASPMYGNIYTKKAKPKIKTIFTDLADEANYPMYLHCTYGADRTGTIVFLLQGILGVPEEEMRREYCLTGLTLSGYKTGEKLNGIYGGLENIPGDTINEKIENYLVDDVGITKDQINRIREIFLED